MLYTYIHHKKYSHVSWNVAHLYEHLATRSFQSYVKTLGINPGLIGHVSGETFEHIIFLNATFYDKRVAEAYRDFLSMHDLIDMSSIPQVLLEIEGEEKVILMVKNKTKFDTQLQSLIEQPWVDNSLILAEVIDESESSEEVFEIKRMANAFRDVVVGVYANVNDLSENEQVLLLRLSVIINDVIEVAIRSKLQGYYLGSYNITKDDSFIGSTQCIRLKKDISLAETKKAAEEALQFINIQSAMPLITAHFREFSDRATWKNVTVDYYRNTGILTNNAHISSLATPALIASTLSKLKIHIRVMQKEDKEWFKP